MTEIIKYEMNIVYAIVIASIVSSIPKIYPAIMNDSDDKLMLMLELLKGS